MTSCIVILHVLLISPLGVGIVTGDTVHQIDIGQIETELGWLGGVVYDDFSEKSKLSNVELG